MAFVTGSPHRRRPLPLLSLVALLGAVACTEQLTTSNTCPALCPEQGVPVQSVELQPVVLDTSVAGFPLLGTESRLMAARSGDTLDTRLVFRFDSLPTRHRLASGDSADITEVVDPVLELLVLRRAVSHVPGPTTVAAYDVTAAGDDTSTAELAAAFTPERRLGEAVLAVRPSGDTTSLDSLRIPLRADAVLAAVAAGADGRLRLGVRIEGSDGRVYVPPTQARLLFRASADSAAPRLVVTLRSRTPSGDAQLQIDQSAFRIVVAGTPPLPEATLGVGGLPGRRALLRFALPPAILDSSAVVRATLVLTQRPVRGFLPTDTAFVVPLAVTTNVGVADLPRRLWLAANAFNPYSGQPALPSDPLRRMPSDSGHFELPIAELVGAWRTTNALGFEPELVLAMGTEGTSPVQIQFFSSEAAPELRPRLRLNYVRRVNFGLP